MLEGGSGLITMLSFSIYVTCLPRLQQQQLWDSKSMSILVTLRAPFELQKHLPLCVCDHGVYFIMILVNLTSFCKVQLFLAKVSSPDIVLREFRSTW